MDTGYLRPEPDPGPDTRPYWEGLKAGEFLVQQCMSCGRKRHYPRPVCDACYSLESEWVPIRGQGRIHSWTVCHHAFLPGFRKLLPYVVAIADIDDGLRVNLVVEGPADQPLKIGDPVRIAFRRVSETLTLPVLVRETGHAD